MSLKTRKQITPLKCITGLLVWCTTQEILHFDVVWDRKEAAVGKRQDLGALGEIVDVINTKKTYANVSPSIGL
jgi:hypothetical protein